MMSVLQDLGRLGGVGVSALVSYSGGSWLTPARSVPVTQLILELGGGGGVKRGVDYIILLC